MRNEPKRIQRKRTKGWRMPEGAIYVGRPTRWGNPFVVDAVLVSHNIWSGDPEFVLDRQHAAALFQDWLLGDRSRRTGFGPIGPGDALLSAVGELEGKDLVCWCPLDDACHADVLLEIANPSTTPSQPATRPTAEQDREPLHRGDDA